MSLIQLFVYTSRCIYTHIGIAGGRDSCTQPLVGVTAAEYRTREQRGNNFRDPDYSVPAVTFRTSTLGKLPRPFVLSVATRTPPVVPVRIAEDTCSIYARLEVVNKRFGHWIKSFWREIISWGEIDRILVCAFFFLVLRTRRFFFSTNSVAKYFDSYGTMKNKRRPSRRRAVTTTTTSRPEMEDEQHKSRIFL